MDNKLLLIFILLFLSFLLLFYYLKLKTNIIMLLSIIIVLCINKLIVQKEYFYDTDNFEHIYDKLIDYLLSNPKNETNPLSKLSFLGSESAEDVPTQKSQTPDDTWQTILSNMKYGHTNKQDNSPSDQIPLPFRGSMLTPSTPSTPSTSTPSTL
jgi:hypothetical protein